MNKSLAVFLASDECRMIKVCYEPGAKSFYEFKTFDKTIYVDDYVVIPTDTRHLMTVAKVTEVDVDPNFDSTQDFKWIVGRVDNEAHEELLAREKTMSDRVQKAELKRKRAQLRQTLIEDIDGDESLLIIDANSSSTEKTE